ncbi:MAG: phospho-N-acetylmuramoyl-pentapeptide-transferase [Bacteroidales bacterium]|nr:phospho-N-acetylmuramoyl-pentapeptide-transferase [Candidatus Colimorpha onthohippi]
MLYYLFDWLENEFAIPGAGVFQYISFRSSCCFICSLLIMILYGKPFMNILRKKGVGETVRTDEQEKQGTPTMGGILIIAAIIIPTLLFAQVNNIYILIMLGTTIWMGIIGFLDDYIKVFKRNKAGLPGKFKVIGQVSLGLVVGLLAVFHPEIASTKTTIPFVKNNEFDYSWLVSWMGDGATEWTWLVYVLIAIFVVTAVSNAANLTDGIDGLATSTGSVIGGALAILAWLSGNVIMSNYLNIVYLNNIGELTLFISSFVGALLGFLWYNSHPASMFMGDVGSLTIGGIIAVFALLIRKELLLPLLCGIYVIEDASVIIQRYSCKWYRHKHRLPANQLVPIEKRPFFYTPLHHHYQTKHRTDGKGLSDEKIVMRFTIIGILLAILTITTFKLR